MKILMVPTSHDKLGDTGRKTGFWLEEFAASYYTFKDAGDDVVLASPKGRPTASRSEKQSQIFRPTLRICSKLMQKQARGTRQRFTSTACAVSVRVIDGSTSCASGR